VPAPIKEFESYFASRDLQYYEVIDTDVSGAMAPET
jgi:hypothetical protein